MASGEQVEKSLAMRYRYTLFGNAGTEIIVHMRYIAAELHVCMYIDPDEFSLRHCGLQMKGWGLTDNLDFSFSQWNWCFYFSSS